MCFCLISEQLYNGLFRLNQYSLIGQYVPDGLIAETDQETAQLLFSKYFFSIPVNRPIRALKTQHFLVHSFSQKHTLTGIERYIVLKGRITEFTLEITLYHRKIHFVTRPFHKAANHQYTGSSDVTVPLCSLCRCLLFVSQRKRAVGESGCVTKWTLSIRKSLEPETSCKFLCQTTSFTLSILKSTVLNVCFKISLHLMYTVT